MSQATAQLQGMLQGVDVTDAVVANVQITAALLAATLLDIKDQAMKLCVVGSCGAWGSPEIVFLSCYSTSTEPCRLAAFRTIAKKLGEGRREPRRVDLDPRGLAPFGVNIVGGIIPESHQISRRFVIDDIRRN